ncbi:PIN-like domain-containing protein [Bacillus thuringiensis]|uniref:PIN-like domain-containing protein n=1 Tax=Bacillus thuringiensis TaxID=1428 RepID=UPI000BF4A9E8|nr:PIN domain-containing protein [Bacillus thuringiensis]PFV41101.1 hypothetical protein COL03_18830 [Bacillus thuringiensis]
MKSILPGYYKMTEAEENKLWDSSIFVFDANVLLGFYATRDKYRETIFNSLEQIQDRLWIPYQVAQEFEKNRIKVIKEQIANYTKIKMIPETLNRTFKKNMDNLEFHPSGKFYEITQVYEEFHNKFEKKLKKINIDLNKEKKEYSELERFDTIREKIGKLFKNNIGRPYKFHEILSIVEEGKLRYQSKIPPGYKDLEDKNGVDAFGDLILWYQILEFINNEKRNVIFITNDVKEDWWNLSNQKKIVSPRSELINEIYCYCGVQGYIYTFDDFFEKLNIKILNKKPEEFEKELQELRNIRSMQNVEVFDYYSIKELATRFITTKEKEKNLLITQSSVPTNRISTVQNIREKFNHYFITSEIKVWINFINQLCFSIFKRADDVECIYVGEIVIHFHDNDTTEMFVHLSNEKILHPNGNIDEVFDNLVKHLYEKYSG